MSEPQQHSGPASRMARGDAGLSVSADPQRWVPVLAFVALVLAIGAVAYYTFTHYQRQIRAERQQMLTAIADLKQRQISDWLGERRNHGELLKRSPLFARETERWLKQGAPAGEVRDRLVARMQTEVDIYGFAKLVLFDRDGVQRLSVGAAGAVAEHERAMAREAVRSGEIIFSDFHRDAAAADAGVELDMQVPLQGNAGKPGGAAGVMYFRIDPRQQFYRLIQSMPIPSATAESLLVRHEGDDVLFLNELRFRHDTALSLRLPLGENRLIAAMAARGDEGVLEGLDYRGVPVLAAVQRIPGTAWVLIVKMDAAEIFQPVSQLSHLFVALTLILAATAGIAVALWWRRQRDKKVARLTRLYATLSQTNQAIVRIGQRQRLFDEICRIAVEFGGFKFAWIGFPGPDGWVRVVASHGYDDGHLESLKISTDAASPLSQGPTGTAIREGRAVVVNDYESDPGMQPWRAQLAERGVFASAAFPLLQEGNANGALTLYATEAHFFDSALITLLEEMATDVSFALDNFEREAARHKAEEALRASDARFRAIFDSVGEAIFVHHLESGAILDVNRRMCEMFGYSHEDALKLDAGDISAGVPPYTRQDAMHWIARAARGEPQIFEWRARDRGGKLFWAEVTMRRADIAGTERLLVSMRDISERKQAEEKLRLDAKVFEDTSEGIMITDAGKRILTVNRAFTQITGYSQDEAVGNTPALLASGRHDRDFYRNMWASINETGQWVGELWNRRKNGEIFPEWLNITVAKDLNGEISNYIGIFNDVSMRKEAEQRIQHLSQYDALTSLPNRLLFSDRLNLAIVHARHARQKVALLYVNLDRFKAINDSLGFEAGDRVLLAVAGRLSGAVREGDTASRLDGDNFVVILPELGEAQDASLVAKKILTALAEPLAMDEHELSMTASIGISLYPDDGDSHEALLRNANAALGRTKAGGRNGYQFYTRDMNERALEILALENGLHHALERGELLLHYQPQVDLQSGEIVAMEALLRWQHPALGMLAPGKFIKVAEDNGTIVPIGIWVLTQACHQAKAWHDAGFPYLRVSVNVSALQFVEQNLAGEIARILAESGLEARFLELEFTESFAMEHAESMIAALRRLKDMGVSLAMDDFGASHSGLGFLKLFPIDRLKVDPSFIRDITFDANDAAIVLAMIAMGHSLKLKVIAEGVETEGQMGYLRSIHCDEMQGYYFSHPLPPEAALQLLGAAAGNGNGGAAASERTLLLVDDEENILTSLKRLFRREGYRILTAGSAREGLELLATHKVEVIISDQRMPEMSGTEFFSRVKLMHPDIVRIILSGYTELHTITDAINMGGIYRFFTKPWEDDELREGIREAFQRYEKSQGPADKT